VTIDTALCLQVSTKQVNGGDSGANNIGLCKTYSALLAMAFMEKLIVMIVCRFWLLLYV
jgi:hypothetical protein